MKILRIDIKEINKWTIDEQYLLFNKSYSSLIVWLKVCNKKRVLKYYFSKGTINTEKGTSCTSDYKNEVNLSKYSRNPGFAKLIMHDWFHIKLGRESNVSFNICVVNSYLEKKYKLRSSMTYEDKLSFLQVFIDYLILLKRAGIRHGSLAFHNIYFNHWDQDLKCIDL